MILFGSWPVLILPLALALDALIGDPDWAWRRAPHPVVLLGWMIGALDRALNWGPHAVKRAAGVAAVLMLIALMGGVGFALASLWSATILGGIAETLLVAVLLAQRSLYDHVRRVYDAFAQGGLPEARRAVSHIVGRDPDALDEAGVVRAAVETTAENYSDGVVAPAFWYLLAGLPGILIYKAVNTADSMIGHRSERYLAFGWASARLDDALNFAPARLSGLFTVIAAWATRRDASAAFRIMLRDAKLHRSPNAGWPEAATAGALGIAIAGPRVYATGPVFDAYVNDEGRKNLHPGDIMDTLKLFAAACAVQWTVCAGAALIVLWR